MEQWRDEMADKYFWCKRWRQQIEERVCLSRYKKGLKKCEGCSKGEAVAREKAKKGFTGSTGSIG